MQNTGYYFAAAGISNILFMTSCTATYAFCLTFSHYILKWWTKSSTANSSLYILIYFLLSLMAWIATNGTMWLVYLFCQSYHMANVDVKVDAYTHRSTIWFYSAFSTPRKDNEVSFSHLLDKEATSLIRIVRHFHTFRLLRLGPY